eukprot:COSAG03_NODE_1161_length_4684_cov_17.828571_2_plen_231_part_00
MTEIHNNALVWERLFQAVDYGAADPDRPGGPGRLLVSGLNIFDAKQPGQLRAGEPQTEFVFRSLLEYAMHQSNAAGFAASGTDVTRDSPAQPPPPPSPLCSRLESFCEDDSTFACTAIAHQVSPSICNGDFACIQPNSLLNSTVNFSQGKLALDSIWVSVSLSPSVSVSVSLSLSVSLCLSRANIMQQANTPVKAHRVINHAKAINRYLYLMALCFLLVDLQRYIFTERL